MITGYEIGTEVKWNEGQSLATGTVLAIYREPTVIEISGERVHVPISDNSPTYLVLRYDGQRLIMAHEDVILKSSNVHT